MDDEVFRKVSLERIASPEQLDQTMTVTSPKSILSLLAAGLLLIAIIVWSVFGTISTRIYGQGILMKSAGIRNIDHLAEGMITDIRIIPGDIIQVGDIVARIDRREQINEIIQMKEDVRQLVEIKNTRQKELETKNKEKIMDIEEQIVYIESLIEKGREELMYSSFVVSPYSGRVLEVKFNKGDILTREATIASVELMGDAIKDLEAVIYIEAEHGKSIYTGMEVKISPSNVKKEEYGFLLGRVISVSEYSATNQGMLSVLGSEEMVSQLKGDRVPVEIRVELIPDAQTQSGYKWSSPQGPPININSGTLCGAAVTIESMAPIEKVFPIR